MEQITIIGNIGKSEPKRIGETDYLEISVACNRKKKDGTALTNWYSCLTRQTGLAPYTTKGKKVLVQGTPLFTAYIAPSTQTARPDVTIFANTIELLGGGEQREENKAGVSEAVKAAVNTLRQDFGTTEEKSDDLPF